MAYGEKVLSHYENPRNVGSLDKEDASVGTGMVGAPACGDVMKLSIKVSKEGVIEDAKFKTYGCLVSNAQIATPDGYQNVCDLNIGDEVWAWNGRKVVVNTIKEISVSEVYYKDLIQLTIEKQGKRKRLRTADTSIICTKDHVWWASDNRPIEAGDLKAGMELLHITEGELRSLKKVGEFDNLKELINFKQIETMDKDDSHIQSMRLEQDFNHLFDKNDIDVRYVGSGDFWVNTEDGKRLNPDFKVNGQRKVIEVYTRSLPTFMVNRESADWMIQRKKQFASANFDCMFIEASELNHCVSEVQRFIHNGIRISSVNAISDKRQLRGVQKNGEQVTVYDIRLHEGANIYFVDKAMSHNCGSAIASSSLLTEWVKGKTLEEASQIKNTEIAEELALPPVKIHCSVLAESSVKAAIEDYQKKQKDLNK